MMADKAEKAAPETGHATDSTSTGEQFESDILQEQQDGNGVIAEPAGDGDEPVYETGWKLWAVLCTIFATTLLAALDIGIVATAIPGITDDFHQLDDVGWYGGACFLLVGTTSQLYKYLSARWVYLASIILFLIGSIVAATAPNSIALIIARAIQGLGIAGTFGGSVLMINYVAPPSQRPMLIGLWMAVLMVSTIIGPLIGGVFTTEVTWRWCFWINLPVGGPIIGMVLLFFHVPKHIKPQPATRKEILLQLDLPGFSLLLSSVVCFTLALQYGGQTKTWNSGSVIATLVMWVVLSIAFIVTEWLQGAYAMVPLHLLKPRMAWTLALYALILSVSVNDADFQVQFYLPIYFQSIHGQSAITSGVNTLPFVAFFALGSVLSGALVGKTRMLHPYLLLSGLLATAGVALLYTLGVDSSKARYIGPEVLVGFGIGLGCQIPMMAIQSFTKPEDVASMSSIIVMSNTISGAYFVTAAQSLFANRLLKTLAVNAPNIDAIKVLGTGASDIQRVFSGADLAAVLDAYMVGIKAVFAFSMAGAAFTAVLTLAIPWKKIPDHDSEKTMQKDAATS